MSIKQDLMQSIIELKYTEVNNLIFTSLRFGLKPFEILMELRKGLEIVGDRYEKGEYFLSELYMAAETMKKGLEILQPLIQSNMSIGSEGTIVLGSIEGDIHDFGKTIVKSLLTASGFDVFDLGVDVPVKKFVDEAEKVNADVIGIAAILSTTQPISKKVIEELDVRGLREKYRVILGGTGVDREKAIEKYGVDAAVNDGSEGVKIIKKWMKMKRRIA